MKRRTLLAAGLVAVATPARPQRMPLTGYLSGRSLATDAHLLQAVKDGLRESGFVDGQNVSFEYRWAAGRFDRLKALAADLMARKPDLVMAVGGTPVPIEMRAVDATVPMVFTIGFDPVGLNLVDSLARPGRNTTGAMLLAEALEGKRLGLLKEMRPDIRSVALLVNATSAMLQALERDAQAAAAALGLSLEIAKAANAVALDATLAGLTARRPGGLAVTIDGFLIGERRRIVDWAARERVPAIFPTREFTEAGGLAS